ncbi:uncharacterized protein Dwil_GK27993 [Drosophila willistoni]|uniref:Uncharacterized protein n=1 Tax=Drosophila willistoni TaxID=7260 RepID=A0A0Q9WZ23_DROWI|nr:uncharacterized protein Dwil_GK27993 [Drosophila willistoni]
MPKAARMSLLQWDTDLANVAEVAVRQCQFESLKYLTSAEDLIEPNFSE